MSVSPRSVFPYATVCVSYVVFGGPVARASDPPPTVVAEFTRVVQPLLFNRCATGCHGRPGAGSLSLVRRDFTGHITREITLANIRAILAACGPERSPATLITAISRRHPKSAASPRELMEPLSRRERAVLSGWLSAACATDAAGSTTATAGEPANRFRILLESAANPSPLPSPQQPQGLIFK